MRYLIVFLFALCFVSCQQNDSIVPDVAKSSKELQLYRLFYGIRGQMDRPRVSIVKFSAAIPKC